VYQSMLAGANLFMERIQKADIVNSSTEDRISDVLFSVEQEINDAWAATRRKL
jgi:hypothetical protein